MDDQHSYIPPDIATASEDYRRRFAGAVGEYFLKRQNEIILSLLPDSGRPLRILEVGGGHLQVTGDLLALGHEVHVHGSTDEALHRLDEMRQLHPSLFHGVLSPLQSLPFSDGHFDAVIGIRLMAHCPDWEKVLGEMCRVASGPVIIDYPPESSFNILYPLLYGFKEKAEGNTRPFLRFKPRELHDFLQNQGRAILKEDREFFLPMVVHRFAKNRKFSEASEGLAQFFGLTKLFGSPVILSASR